MDNKHCDYCNFIEEYVADKPLDYKEGYLSDCSNKQSGRILDIKIVENYEYERFIEIETISQDNIFIPIKYCPICGRKL